MIGKRRWAPEFGLIEVQAAASQWSVFAIAGPKSRDALNEIVEDADPRGREAPYLDGEKVGRLTSGGYSVAFGKSIGMGYVEPEPAVPGTRLKVRMFNDLWEAEVVEDSPYDPENAATRKDG